jgi:hypothetical protein
MKKVSVMEQAQTKAVIDCHGFGKTAPGEVDSPSRFCFNFSIQWSTDNRRHSIDRRDDERPASSGTRAGSSNDQSSAHLPPKTLLSSASAWRSDPGGKMPRRSGQHCLIIQTAERQHCHIGITSKDMRQMR